MTLADFRAALLLDVCDPSQDYLSNSDADSFINRALVHVSNWAHSVDEGLFQTSLATGSLSTAAARKTYTIASPLFARSLIAAERTDAGLTSGTKALKIERVTTVESLGSDDSRPRLYLAKPDQIVFIDTPANMTATVWYYHTMPHMTSGTDTPGQAGGTGESNALPVEYHPLVSAYAAVLALQADRLDASQEWASFRDQRDSLLASLRGRSGKRDAAGARQ